jgi:excinuclease ABC A subunit
MDQKLILRIQPHLINTIKRAKQLHIDHLQLNRKSMTLSGGENQRVALIKQLNSPLKGIAYLLDEPSAGLSNNNIPDLVNILKELVEKGNTVIVIEHNKEIILKADKLIEIGPKAGKLGGYLTFQGNSQEYLKQKDSPPFLKEPSQPIILKESENTISFRKISKHTLVKAALKVPVGGITAISGKSGIGKTTLVKDILIPSIETGKPVNCESIKLPKKYSEAHYFEPKKLRTHANTLLVSYLDLLKEISKIFASETNLKPRDFSYKTKTSQCENCKGKGYLETSLDVAANAIEKCEVCRGKRYQQHILEHTVDSKDIAEVLAFNLIELKQWFEEMKVSEKIISFLNQMEKIGLLHLHLDQAVQSLSSGEKQRLLLLNWLQSPTTNALYILDEPSTGLHYADIDLLFEILKKLSKNNDLLIIDHNPYLLQKIGVGVVLE